MRTCKLLCVLAVAVGLSAPAFGQGPVVLMGIDAEDGGVGGHGPISVYESVLTNGSNTGILDTVSNGGTGILVIGGNKSGGDNVTQFWNQINADLGGGLVTFVNGAANITAASFAGKAMLAVVSDAVNTPSGGLTNAENDALSLRAADVAAFVNGGGGLLGFSSTQLSDPYGYLGSIGSFTFNSPAQFENVTPTAEGLNIGITDAMDICCWHDEYASFPSFLGVLATNAASGVACAIGGSSVVIPGQISFLQLLAFNEPGTSHTATVSVLEAQPPNDPIVGVVVNFAVISGPNAGAVGNDITDGNGEASFTYTSNGLVGVDEIQACFDDPNDEPDQGLICTSGSSDALKFWDEDCNANAIPDTCDIDCDGFGGLCDAFDPDCGSSLDSNGDGQPDDCNQSPDCSGAYASPDTLWPPNHKFHVINILGVTDPDGDPVTITIRAIFQDEPTNGQGDGDTCPDARGIGSSRAIVRAERSGLLDGRVYHILYSALDGQGGECRGSVTVCVPHDQGQGNQCGDQGPLFDSTQCPSFAVDR